VFTLSKWHKFILAVWTGCSIGNVSWNFSCFSNGGMSLVIWDLAASASYNLKVGWPRTQAKLFIHQIGVKSTVENVKVKIAGQIYIFGECKFLVDSQILNWTNKACFREKLHLGSLGSKKPALRRAHLPKLVVFQLLKVADANLHHAVTVTNCPLLNFTQV
jgi:hypothetical protein